MPKPKPEPKMVEFGHVTSDAPPEGRGKPGPKPTRDALTARLRAGELKHLHVMVNADTHRRLRVIAATEDVGLSDLVQRILDRHLSE